MKCLAEYRIRSNSVINVKCGEVVGDKRPKCELFHVSSSSRRMTIRLQNLLSTLEMVETCSSRSAYKNIHCVIGLLFDLIVIPF
jgi:hypothetical protein